MVDPAFPDAGCWYKELAPVTRDLIIAGMIEVMSRTCPILLDGEEPAAIVAGSLAIKAMLCYLTSSPSLT